MAAAARGGECLSESYENCRALLRWRCAEGHQWDVGLFSVRQGHWCPKCGAARRAVGKRNTMRQVHALAEHKGGKCLSVAYTDSKGMLIWECQAGHQWRASYNHISRGRWCPTCANAKKADALRINTIDVARAVAARRGGECLSSTYSNSYSHLRWKCDKGHEWSASLNMVKDVGTWCPGCAQWKREAECRKHIEELTGYTFPPAQPAFLEGLKYDGYCPELRIAFEHNGIQHYEETPYFHRTDGALADQQRRDARKEELSSDHFVALVVIPYWVWDIRGYVAKELGFLGGGQLGNPKTERAPRRT